MEVMNILHTKTYGITEEEKVPIIEKQLGREYLQLTQTFTNFEKDACKKAESLLSMLGAKLKPHQNETILSLQYCKCKEKVRSLPRIEWAGFELRPKAVNTKNMTEV